MLVKAKNFSTRELSRFRELQRRSFAILEETGAGLETGVTEVEVARRLVRRYRDAGAKAFFHLPVVLFGDRTALPGEWRVRSFYPTERSLQARDAVILDASPIFAAFMVDTSYSFCFGEDAAHQQMMLDIAGYRTSVLADVRAGKSFKAIADDVRGSLRAKGYEPAHAKHPGEVLGHRALKRAVLPWTWRIQGSDGLSLSWFQSAVNKANASARAISPLWNDADTSDHPPADGLWLVEPHAGAPTIGAKWEEILVVQDGAAHWLDETPPHVWQWQAIQSGQSYRPRATDLAA